MDNDLMARRLRPPSEPISSLPPTGPMPTPSWMQQPATEQPLPPSQPAVPEQIEMAGQPQVASQPQMATQTRVLDQSHAPEAREEVPWDRPSDYTQPTDTAAAGEPAWDRPQAQAPWDDSAVYDDRAAEMFEPEPEPEIYGAMVAAAAASESAVAEAVASFAPEPVAQAPISAVAAPMQAWQPNDPASDPDDAFAPVLDDVHNGPASGWHEPAAYAEFGESAPATSEQSRDFWTDAWQSGPAGSEQMSEQTSPSAYVPVEPRELAGTGVGPTPPAELFTEAPSIWTAPTSDEPSADAFREDTVQEEPEPTQDAQLAVTAEQAWQAYEAFTTEQETEPHVEKDEGDHSAAVLEIEVPQVAAAESVGAAKPQQLVLRIELAIVDGSGRRVDPANVSVRVMEASDEPPWPTEAEAPPEPPVTEPTRWLEPEPTLEHPRQEQWTREAPVPPQPASPAATTPQAAATTPQAAATTPTPAATPSESAFASRPSWAGEQPIHDPLSALSAPPPPSSNPARQASSQVFASPSFAPPSFAPQPRHQDVAPATATPATASEAASTAVVGGQSEPRFRAPPVDEGSDGGAPADAPSDAGSRKVALYTLGAGLVVVALVLIFLRMMTNII